MSSQWVLTSYQREFRVGGPEGRHVKQYKSLPFLYISRASHQPRARPSDPSYKAFKEPVHRFCVLACSEHLVAYLLQDEHTEEGQGHLPSNAEAPPFPVKGCGASKLVPSSKGDHE